MFESAEVGNKLDKATYKLEAPKVRAGLLEAQKELAGADFSVIVVVAGVDGAGKSETANLLLEWMDARGIQTHVLLEPTDEERQRPSMWRFWRVLPPRGRMAIFFGLWDTNPAVDAVFNHLTRSQLDQPLDRMVKFERMLYHENILLVKFWLHLSGGAQKSASGSWKPIPDSAGASPSRSGSSSGITTRFARVSEHVLRRTNTSEAPWHIVEAADGRYRNLTVAQTLLQALRNRLDQAKAGTTPTQPAPLSLQPPPRNVLNQLDMSLAVMDRKEYEQEAAQGAGQVQPAGLPAPRRTTVHDPGL